MYLQKVQEAAWFPTFISTMLGHRRCTIQQVPISMEYFI